MARKSATTLRRLALALPFLAAACRATVVEPDTIEDPHFVAADGSFALELPVGWLRAENTLTLDGPERQVIVFNAGDVLAEEDARPIDASSPELLAAMRDRLEAEPGIELVECRAASLDGLPGFRMHFRKAPAEGEAREPATEVVIYCAIDGTTLFALSLESRSPETFERDSAVLERIVASFERLGSPR